MGFLDNMISGAQSLVTSPAPAAPVGPTAPSLPTAPAPVPLTASPVGGAPSYPVQPTPPGGAQSGQTEVAPVEDQQSRYKSGEQGQESIRASRWDQWAAGWEELSHGMPVGLPGADSMGAIPRYLLSKQTQNYSDQSGGPVLDPKVANEMYPGRPEQYTAPVSQMVAELEYNDRQRMAKLEAWKRSTSPTPWTDSAQGLAGGFADPLIAALSLGAGPLVGRFAGEAPGALAKLGTRFGENLGINAVTGAVSYGVEKSEGAAPTVGGAVKQAVAGAIGGTLFGYATDALSAGLKGAFARFRSESPDTQARITKEVISALDKNTTPNLESQHEVLEQRRAGAIQEGKNVQRITPPENMPTQVFGAVDHNGVQATFHDGLGPGAQRTSSPDVANNKVSNPEGGAPGHIGETKIDPEKLLNVDKSASVDFKSENGDTSFLKALEEKTKLPIEEMVNNGQSIADVIKNLGEWAGHEGVPADILQQAQDVAKAQGYDGYSLLQKDSNGNPTDHVAHMFDENHPITGQISQANPEITPKLTDTEVKPGPQETQNPPNSVYSSPEMDKSVHDFKHGGSLNATPEYMDPFVKDIFDQAHEQLTRMSETSETAKEALEQLRRLSADGKQRASMAEKLADCVSGGMS